MARFPRFFTARRVCNFFRDVRLRQTATDSAAWLHRSAHNLDNRVVQGRVRWHLPEMPPKALGKFKHLDRVAAALDELDGTAAAIARELDERIRELTGRSDRAVRDACGNKWQTSPVARSRGRQPRSAA